MYQSDKSWD